MTPVDDHPVGGMALGSRGSVALIEIETQSIARRYMREQFQELRRELEEQGHTVSFRAPAEERAVPTAGPGFQVALHLSEFLDERVLEAIIGALVATIVPPERIPVYRGRRDHRAEIFGPDGRVLRDVVLEGEEPGE
jgi:hypothetical protein